MLMRKNMKSSKKIQAQHIRTQETYSRSFIRQVEDFFLSDSLSATATKFLLMFIAMGGVAFVGATLPGLIKAIGAFHYGGRGNRKMNKQYPKQKIANSLAFLKRQQLIEILEASNGMVKVRLTNKGKKRLAEYSLSALEIRKPEKWDGKWRVLMFDIPAHPKTYQYARDALRNKIKKLGFRQIQKSVWVYPYECEDELLFIAEMFKVQKYIEILTVERFLHEKSVRAAFPSL